MSAPPAPALQHCINCVFRGYCRILNSLNLYSKNIVVWNFAITLHRQNDNQEIFLILKTIALHSVVAHVCNIALF